MVGRGEGDGIMDPIVVGKKERKGGTEMGQRRVFVCGG